MTLNEPRGSRTSAISCLFPEGFWGGAICRVWNGMPWVAKSKCKIKIFRNQYLSHSLSHLRNKYGFTKYLHNVLACSSSTASTHEVKVCKKQTHGSTTPGRWKSGMTSNDIRSFRWCDVTFTILSITVFANIYPKWSKLQCPGGSEAPVHTAWLPAST